MSPFLQRKPRMNCVRAEKMLVHTGRLDDVLFYFSNMARTFLRLIFRRDKAIVRAILKRSQYFETLSDKDLEQSRIALANRLRIASLNSALIIESFALIREVSFRVLGMRHHSTQVLASLHLLRGSVAEMATGEGKTLAATLAVATSAMAGVPVHLVTVNDYLAERDCEEMMPLYLALGLSSDFVVHDMEPDERRIAYRSDICYCSNKELVFDYLKDQIALKETLNKNSYQQSLYIEPSLLQKLVLRGLYFAVVDEADSIFVDESRTPLIISGEESFGENEEKLIREALLLAGDLEDPIDFYQTETGGIRLTEIGHEKIAREAKVLSGIWLSVDYREQLVLRALTALHRYQLNQDYIINDEGEVQIVDPYTGRVTPGRSWGQGLHQMVEIKEGVELSKPRQTNAEISYQNFFRKYHFLAGMTGTGLEVKKEFSDVFRLPCLTVPLLIRSRRKLGIRKVFSNLLEKYQGVTAQVSQLHATGQPVLVGTATVKASEMLASCFTEANIPHTVLNARQDKQEAEIVAQAGQLGAVTIATGLAGRGTDIKLSEPARELGGLHVIITELQDASRIDRQFYGRSARQGDPGSYSLMLSLDDTIVKNVIQPSTRYWLGLMIKYLPWKNLAGYGLIRYCQRRQESLHYQQRKKLLAADFKRQQLLSYSGRTDYQT